MEYREYEGWFKVGRFVVKGQKSTAITSTGKRLFERSQTKKTPSRVSGGSYQTYSSTNWDQGSWDLEQDYTHASDNCFY